MLTPWFGDELVPVDRQVHVVFQSNDVFEGELDAVKRNIAALLPGGDPDAIAESEDYCLDWALLIVAGQQPAASGLVISDSQDIQHEDTGLRSVLTAQDEHIRAMIFCGRQFFEIGERSQFFEKLRILPG